MKLMMLLVTIGAMTLLAACGGGGNTVSDEAGQSQSVSASAPAFDQAVGREEAFAIAPLPPQVLPATAPATNTDSAVEPAMTAGVLDQADRKVITTASVSLEVKAVQQAIAGVRSIATSLGGFMEQLQSYGGTKQQQATVVVHVPQAQFFPALDQITALGEMLSQSVGSQDVTEQFIDLEARLKSALRQEESLLSLLSRAENVSEVLSIERELTRVRSEIERFQGQLAFLGRRVDLATITVTLSEPFVATEPPSASLTVEVRNVTESVDEVKRLMSSLDGSVDSVFLSNRGGKEEANVAVRVFASGFASALATIEKEGKLVRKEVREGKGPASPDTARPDEPDAPIVIAFTERTPSLIVRIVVIAIATGLVAALAILLRRGWRRLRPGTTTGA